MHRTTGQIITRPAGQKAPDGKRVLVAIVGIIAVDPESMLNVEGRQFIVAGPAVPEMDPRPGTELFVMEKGAIDRAQEIAGDTLGDTLMMPIWRS